MYFKRGHIPWNKGRSGIYKTSVETKKKLSEIGKKIIHTPEWNLNVSKALTGKKHIVGHTEEWKKKNGEMVREQYRLGKRIPPLLGKRLSQEERLKRRKTAVRGEKSHLWRGGITPLNHKIRTSLEYKLWREAVFKRDSFTCIWCGQIGGKLNADHIKPFSLFPELRFNIDNGRTLCLKCHKTTDTYLSGPIHLHNEL